MTLKALNNYIYVETLPKIQGIVKEINSNEFDIQGWARVLTVAEGTIDASGSNVPIPIEKDEIVYCHRHGMIPIMEDKYIVSEYDIMLTSKNGTITPLGNRILVEILPEEDNNKLKLFRVNNQLKKVVRAKVLKVGTGWKDMFQNPIPFQVKEGDIVLFDKYQLAEIPGKDAGLSDVQLVNHGDLLLKEDVD